MTRQQRQLISHALGGIITTNEARMQLKVGWSKYYRLMAEYKSLYWKGGQRAKQIPASKKPMDLIFIDRSEDEMLRDCEAIKGERYQVRKRFWLDLCGGGEV